MADVPANAHLRGPGRDVGRPDAVLANYGVTDEVLLQTIFGERKPGGRLPFELPSSMAAVAAQRPDVPNDSARPLFAVGAGLSYSKLSTPWNACSPRSGIRAQRT